MQPGRSVERNVCKHILKRNNPFAIALEMEVAGDARVCGRQRRQGNGQPPNEKNGDPAYYRVAPSGVLLPRDVRHNASPATRRRLRVNSGRDSACRAVPFSRRGIRHED